MFGVMQIAEKSIFVAVVAFILPRCNYFIDSASISICTNYTSSTPLSDNSDWIGRLSLHLSSPMSKMGRECDFDKSNTIDNRPETAQTGYYRKAAGIKAADFRSLADS
jgi:hypothetical protein